MFRFSLIVCVSLVCGITAKPWNKLPAEIIQENVMSVDDKGKLSWGVEVEPPEDMDELHYEIDPSMRIWRSVTGNGQGKKHLMVEEDLDELYHPSMEDLRGKIQNLDVLPAANVQAEPMKKNDNTKYRQKAEEDKDAIDHPVFMKVAPKEPEQNWDEVDHKAREELAVYLGPLTAEHKARAKVHGAFRKPEKDEDQLYHREVLRLPVFSPVQVRPLQQQMMAKSEVRVHLKPEEDMDALYHMQPLKPVPHQYEPNAAAPVDFPLQRKYSEPERDLDDLYHH